MDSPAGHPATVPSRRRALLTFTLRHPWFVGTTILLLVTFAVWLWWSWRVNQLLTAQNAELRARGIPAEPAEVIYRPLPDEQNAWLLIGKAMQMDDQSSPSNRFFSDQLPPYPPYPALWIQAAQTSEKNNAQEFKLLRAARGIPKSQARTDVSQLFGNVALAGGAYYVQNTLSDSAIYQQLYIGDDREAIERIRDMLRLSRAIAEENVAVDQFRAALISYSAAATTLILAPGIRRFDRDTRESMCGLIAEFLDDQPLTKTFPRSVRLQGIVQAHDIREASAGTLFLRPLASRAIVSDRKDALKIAQAAEAGDLQTAQKGIETAVGDNMEELYSTAWELDDQRLLPRYSRWFSHMGLYPARRWVAIPYAYLADRRLAAVSLAAQLYRHDHDGAWPAKLQDLVPAYLPAVPKDPSFADGRPLGYLIVPHVLPDGQDRVVVSVGPPPTADSLDSEPTYEQSDYKNPTDYRDLARWIVKDRRFDVEARRKMYDSVQSDVEATTSELGFEFEDLTLWMLRR